MLRNPLITIVLLSLIQACTAETGINKVWELDGFSTPESVLYDETNNVLYVSNINGSALEKDNNGFISRVSPDGEMLELKWVEDMNAPKGLALHSGKLYVTDIDSLIEIDIESGSISQRYVAEDAKFLNDVTTTMEGKVYVSDMLTNTIYCLHEGVLTKWLEDAQLNSPNGLLAESDRLIVATWGVMTEGFATDVAGHMKAVSYHDKTITSIGDGSPIGNLDGVEAIQDNYLVTDWMVGKLFQVDQSSNAKLLLQLEQGMADHEWIASKSMVLLPMMMNDKLLAYHFEQ